MRKLYPFEIERNALALRIGTDLPKPRKLKVATPGFALGSCEQLHFSPNGDLLVAVTANGTFLWDVATGARRLKLKVPSNPSKVVFSDDGDQVLIRNEQGQFVRLSLPDGTLLARFKAKYPYRLEGTPGIGPNNVVLQLAYQGNLLQLDGDDGKVLNKFELDPTGCSGEAYWFSGLGYWIVAQRSVNDSRGRGLPGGLWRLDPASKAPIRLPGEWDSLITARTPNDAELLLLHVVEPGRPPRCILERWDLGTGERTPLGKTPESSIAMPSVSHDANAFGVAGTEGPYIKIGGDVVELPCRGYVQFHPAIDLVAISGQNAFVCPRDHVAEYIPTLQTWRLESDLSGRGYGRLSALGGKMPTRFVVFAREGEWLMQRERIDGLAYYPTSDTIRLADSSATALAQSIDALLHRSASYSDTEQSATPVERRSFHGGTITPPSSGWKQACAIGWADDAVEVWPLKPTGEVAFEHAGYPVAVLSPDVGSSEIVAAIRRMLTWFKPRRS